MPNNPPRSNIKAWYFNQQIFQTTIHFPNPNCFGPFLLCFAPSLNVSACFGGHDNAVPGQKQSAGIIQVSSLRLCLPRRVKAGGLA